MSSDSSPKPARIPVPIGRAQLKAAGLVHMAGSSDPRGEYWIGPGQQVEYIPYVGPPYGQDFSEEGLNEALDNCGC